MESSLSLELSMDAVSATVISMRCVEDGLEPLLKDTQLLQNFAKKPSRCKELRGRDF